MRERHKIFALILIMSVIAVSAMSSALYFQYKAEREQQRARLRETVQSWARIIESIARHAENHNVTDDPNDAYIATLDQIKGAAINFEGFGITGEFTLARRENDQIVFLLARRHDQSGNFDPISFSSKFAEPMRKALSGESGTLFGLDYRGVPVMAAYEPVAFFGLGIVAKIDLAEVGGPFVRTALLSSGVALAFIVLGTFLFLRIGNPIILKLENYSKDLETKIAEQEKSEQALSESEARWRTLAESSPDHIVTMDRDLVIEFVNFPSPGLTIEELIGNSIITYLPPEDQKPVKNLLEGVFRSGKPTLYETTYSPPQGPQIIYESIVIPRYQGKEIIGLTLSARDITEKKESQERQEAFSKELERINKELVIKTKQAQEGSEFKSKLLYMVSHDLRTPLHNMMGYLSLLVEQDKQSEASLVTIGRMKRNANKLSVMIDNLLDSASIERSKLQLYSEPVDLREVINEAVETVHAIAEEKHIRLLVDIDEPVPKAFVDRDKLQLILINLLGNALKFTQEGEVTLRALPINGSVAIQVEDTGIGMTPDELDVAFESFRRSPTAEKHRFAGTGLGLHISKELISLMNGSIQIESRPGQGTVVTLSMPRG